MREGEGSGGSASGVLDVEGVRVCEGVGSTVGGDEGDGEGLTISNGITVDTGGQNCGSVKVSLGFPSPSVTTRSSKEAIPFVVGEIWVPDNVKRTLPTEATICRGLEPPWSNAVSTVTLTKMVSPERAVTGPEVNML